MLPLQVIRLRNCSKNLQDHIVNDVVALTLKGTVRENVLDAIIGEFVVRETAGLLHDRNDELVENRRNEIAKR